jgi:hypothetical protein
MTADDICSLIAKQRYHYRDELQLQEGIQAALTHNCVAFVREHRLNATDRPDFMVGSMVIEVKIKGQLAKLRRQIERYALNPDVCAVVVVTDKMRLSNLPDELYGKPVRVVTLIGAFA